MEKKDNLIKMNVLKRRRCELLVSLAARRRLNNLSPPTPEKCEEKHVIITTNTRNEQVSSLHSNSSDVIEDSDMENNSYVTSTKPGEINSSGDSENSCNTSTFCLPLTHSFFRSPHKPNKNNSFQPTKRESKIHILSEIIISPAVTKTSTSISPERSDKSYNVQIDRSPAMLSLVPKSKIEMVSDTINMQHELPLTDSDNIGEKISPKTMNCAPKTKSQDLQLIDMAAATNFAIGQPLETKQSALRIQPEDIVLQSPKDTSFTTGANIDLSPQIMNHVENNPTSPATDYIAPIHTSPDMQNISANLLANTFHSDTDTDVQCNSPSIIALNDPYPSNYIDVVEPVPGPSLYSQKEDTPKKRKRHLRLTINKAHFDFLSDEEHKDFSAGSSDLWSNCETDISSDSTNKKKRKIKTKKMKDTYVTIKDKEAASLIKKKEKRNNTKKIRKQSKAEGKAYKTKTGVTVDEKKMKENPCVRNKCVRGCFDITEERRTSLFNHFWNLDSQRRRDWLLRCIQKVPIKRKRTSTPESRRTATYDYFINDGEDHRKVCQKFIMYTLDISQKYIVYTIHNAAESMAKQDMRKPNILPKYTEEIKGRVAEFIKSLPMLPSHYNRPKTDKMYLPQEYKSTVHIYRKYLENCKINGYQPVSETLFRQIFNEYNITIHVPKKDKCQICTKFENSKNATTDQENQKPTQDKTHQAHLNEKNATYRRFQSQQNASFSKDTLTTSFDLQKVLNTPYGESMLLYYSRKYAVYNLTFYESGTQEVFCFTWGESDGKRGSNEIATCLLKYLENIDNREIKNLLLYCDSCSGQNKNKKILALLNYFLKKAKNLKVIQINYLLPGHTYMPVDSVHAVIEREVKKLIVWSPSQWPTYFQSARKNPRPYRVEVLDHTDFLNFAELAEQTFTPSILKKMGFKQIRTATFKKQYPDQVRLKYSMTEEAEETRVTLQEVGLKKGTGKSKGKCKGKSKSKGMGKFKTENARVSGGDFRQDFLDTLIKPAYVAKLPISKAKYKDLMRLCESGTIPKTYHKEYSEIPCDDHVRDYFLYSDDEEVD